jgi:hypothetical protein
MYNLNTLLVLCGLVGIIIFWFETLRVREYVIRACRNLCEKSGLQLLDQTVAQTSLNLTRSVRGGWQLRRIYRFEVSNNGADRATGYITMLGNNIEAIQIDNPDGVTTIYPTLPGSLH